MLSVSSATSAVAVLNATCSPSALIAVKNDEAAGVPSEPLAASSVVPAERSRTKTSYWPPSPPPPGRFEAGVLNATRSPSPEICSWSPEEAELASPGFPALSALTRIVALVTRSRT